MQIIHSKSFASVILLSIVLLKHTQNARGGECVDVSNPQIRSFETLLNLQANKVPFNPASPNFAGNYITVEENLENIGRNAFISYTSNSIIKIFLGNRQIKQIEEGAFISLDCLKMLDLQRNLIGNITRNMFEGLAILQELNLGENNLREIPELVFTLMPRLKTLNLTKNYIKILHADSFFNVSLLEQLDLSYNRLHHFEPGVLSYFRSLTNLQLGSNQIDRMEFEKWNLPSLQKLNLSDNILVSFDTSYDFIYGNTLKELYLDHNYLTQLNPYGLRKHLPNLALININDNPWACPHLAPLVMAFNDTRVSYRGSSTDNGLNIQGIACNRSMDAYTKNKPVDIEEDTEAPSKANTDAPGPSASVDVAMEKLLVMNVHILESVKRMQAIAAALFVIVIIFILVDIAIRIDMISCISGMRNRISIGSNRSVIVNSEDHIENSCLLRDRH